MRDGRHINLFLMVSLALHILLLAGFRISSQERERPVPDTITFQLDISRPELLPEPVNKTTETPGFTPKQVLPPASISRMTDQPVSARRISSVSGYRLGPDSGTNINTGIRTGIAVPVIAGFQAQETGLQAPVAGSGVMELRLSAGESEDAHIGKPMVHGQRDERDGSQQNNGGKAAPGEIESPEFRLPSLVKASVSSRVEPVYPLEARRQGLGGNVMVRIKISDSGRVTAVEILRSSGQASLDKAALQAARRWRFDPARQGNDNIPDAVTVNFKFDLQARDKR
ncbi:MAG: energy transducer TonB [bacterium]|jgi:TonB family protein|nr:energy transducer TonB [bacterium]MDD4152293.1 energy transducer TonB [bacterium]MDD4557341.1 energy transducer TonB [bacterium]